MRPQIAVAALMVLCGGCAEAWHARSLATFSMRAPTEGEPVGIVRVVYRCCSCVQACECQCVGPLHVPCSRLPCPGRHGDDLPAEGSWSTRGAGGSARYVAAVFPRRDTHAGKQPRLRIQRKRRGRALRQSARGDQRALLTDANRRSTTSAAALSFVQKSLRGPSGRSSRSPLTRPQQQRRWRRSRRCWLRLKPLWRKKPGTTFVRACSPHLCRANLSNQTPPRCCSRPSWLDRINC